MRIAALARTLVLTALVLLLLAACGGPEEQLGAKASARLEPLTEQVRARALASDPAGTRQALVAVRDAALAMRRHDTVSAARVREILAAVAAVERRLSLVPTTTTTAPPRVVPRGDEGDQNDPGGNGKGNGKGKGRD